MELRKTELKKMPEQRKDEVRKSRFQILKLEERIAPHCSPHKNPGDYGWSLRHYRGCL